MADHSTTTRNVQREKRGVASDLANPVELLPGWSLLLVLSFPRSCFDVDAQQLVATDLDSRVRRSLWISGANVNEEPHPQVPATKFLDEEERRNTLSAQESFHKPDLGLSCDGVCCLFTL